MFPVIPCVKMSPSAKVPSKVRVEDVGFDLYADEDVLIYPHQVVKVKTSIKMAIPAGYAGFIFDKSGVGSKGVKVFGGVIDSSYRGEIIVCLGYLVEERDDDNNVVTRNEYGFPSMYEVKKGEKVAQICFLQTPYFSLEESSELGETDRGERGFGSTGLK